MVRYLDIKVFLKKVKMTMTKTNRKMTSRVLQKKSKKPLKMVQTKAKTLLTMMMMTKRMKKTNLKE